MQEDNSMSLEPTPIELDKTTEMEVDQRVPDVKEPDTLLNKVMQDLGHEVTDFQVSHWHVTNWRHLEKRITGPEFEVGGHKWRILLFPFGNNNQECTSIYLDYADPKAAPPGWHVCVQFALFISNPNDTSVFFHHTATHRFTADESDWGFTRFYELKKMMIPPESKSRPLLENDELLLSAYVRVINDTTGVLWHNFINYDSKKETGYVGLKNQGATCYMNSLLQSLYCTNFFRKATFQIPTENDEPTKSVALALQRVFYLLQTSNSPVGTTELTKSFGWDSLDSFMQHDVQEFNRVLQDNLEGKMKGTAADGAIQKLFVGKMKSYIKCLNVDYESSRVENYYDIQLNVKGCKNLRESFVDYCAVETLEGDNKYMAEGYGLQDAKKGVIFESFPPVLHLQLKRFEYDFMNDAMVKINDRHEFPLEINLDEFLSADADKSVPHNYLLHGVLVHSGDLHGGHYFALLKPEKNGKWFKFDDDRVIPVTEKEILEDNYGGESLQPNQPGLRQTYRMKRFTNAYMLVYIRESALDDILDPIAIEDIPEHLRKRFDAEKAAAEARRREKEEMHLYLNVKILTDQSIRHHQGFDLANFDGQQADPEFVNFKLRKDMTFGALKAMLVKQHNVQPEQMRLWAMVSRQNKTIRPDTPISDSDAETKLEVLKDKHNPRWGELRLYLDIMEHPFMPQLWFPSVGPAKGFLMAFIKYYDPKLQAMENLGKFYLGKTGKVGDVIPHLLEAKGLPSGCRIKIYEEIKPGMIEVLNPKSTFQQAEIQDGDILCFQKEAQDKEVQELGPDCLATIPEYFDFIATRIVVLFKPKFKDREPRPEIELVLGKKMSYDTVALKLAEELKTDHLKLRFTSVNPPTGAPKNIIKRTTGLVLNDMLQPSYMAPTQHVLYYEMLDVSILELETKKFLKVNWLGTNAKVEETPELLVPKNSVVSDVIDTLSAKVKLSADGTQKIRMYEALNSKIHREFSGNEPIVNIPDYVTLYAEEIPVEEESMTDDDRLVACYHFSREPNNSHGVPFKFVVKKDEPFSETKKRLQSRLGMNDKDFSKIKLALVSFSGLNKPKYLEDDEVLSETECRPDDFLGLDHPDRTPRASRFGEKAIKIFN
ncbi:ubiquitin carboxyl-terminal hydrolase 5 [Basidiobolus meristosporus CBS 931.73]|uniref:ubiquitinyl hydrolase 1 n=1 Tax=Basidiobolus meristosporus CBS 931.73 TaxID=1314790 RepID=A0A1Y1XVF2_9FUNG|nr:ubiquitin carboxyl-terminal hydrolase 5 [Basidiobolus meristosporus CBS 931.73]|eukprot:ORX89747.1 ubiquitin carboxyl-terminal hydrolase 5 [Basidiobolus meristosporus CBS 931.73]